MAATAAMAVATAAAHIARKLRDAGPARRVEPPRSAKPDFPARQPPDPAPPADTERDQVLAQPLSPALDAWICEYAAFGPRDLYLWRWCALGVRLTTLPGVLPDLWEHACDTKLLSIMLNVLVDDVADCRQASDVLPALLNAAQGHEPSVGHLNAHNRAHVDFTLRVRREYLRRAREYPGFEKYQELLQYDLSQLFNAIHYSAMLNQQLGLLNVVEHDLYSPHNMMMMSFATLDLMCLPQFDGRELGRLREAIWHAQWMGRIGNLLATWQREIAVGDFTSGVFARAVTQGEITIDELERGDRRQISDCIESGKHQEYYRRRWKYHRQRFQLRAAEVNSVPAAELKEGHERFFHMHMGSKGLI